MNENEILTESQRCLNCANPRCKASCPLGVNIPRMIEYFKNGKIKEAYEIDFESNPFGLICGLICPHEKQCKGACVRGLKEQPVSIGQIEHSICKVALDSFHKGGFYSPAQSSIKQIDTSQKVAIIGGGPAGLSCAHELSKANIKSTIFEKESFLGGILMYGIPDFRLDKKLVNKAIDNILNNNIEVIYGTEYCEKGETALNIAKLKEKGYKYIFISTGLEANKKLEIPGISSKKVLYANEYLREYYENGDLKSESKKIAVIGGGNVAIDTARVAKKLGNDVTIVYRKTRVSEDSKMIF